MKLRHLFIALVAAAALCGAQSFPQITTQQITFNTIQNPTQVRQATVNVVGQPGPNLYYIWIVANYPIGNATPSPAFLVRNAPITLTASNYLLVSWTPTAGATSYDVLMTTNDTTPSGTGDYAAATGVTATSYEIKTNTLSSYTVNTYSGNANFMVSDPATGAGVSGLTFAANGQNQMVIGSGGSSNLYNTWANNGTISGGAVNPATIAATTSILSPNIEQVRYADQFSTVGAAITSGCNGTTPGLVVLPPGTTNSAAIALPSNCTLSGFSGLEGSVLKANNGVDTDFITAPSTSNVELSNLTIDGNETNQTAGSCIDASSVSGLKIENDTIQNCYAHGIEVVGTSSTVTIAHNVVSNTANGSGIILGNTPPNAQVQYFSILDNDVSGSGVADGIFVIGSLSSGTFGTGYGVIADNRVHGNADTGIEVGQATHDIAVTGNQVQPGNTAGSIGIMVRSAKNIQVAGNEVLGTGASTQDCFFTWNGGGDATSISNVDFTGNTAQGCGRYGFNLNAGSDILLAGNKSKGNTTGAYNIGAATNVREYGNDNDFFTSPSPIVFDATNGDPQITANSNAGQWINSTGTACQNGGLWRLVNSSGSLLLNQNTATACDFSTNDTALAITEGTLAAAFGGAVSVPSVVINSGAALATSNQTGTGSIVMSASPILTGTTTVAVLANGCSGVSGAMTAGTITITNACITGSRPISLVEAAKAGTQGILSYTQAAGSLVITSSSNTDTSTVSWVQN